MAKNRTSTRFLTIAYVKILKCNTFNFVARKRLVEPLTRGGEEKMQT